MYGKKVIILKINKYFECVDMHRKGKGNIATRWLKYHKLHKFLKDTSPSYDDLKEMAEFVKILEFSCLYSNEVGYQIDTLSGSNMDCPIIASINEKSGVSNIRIPKGRYTIEIELSDSVKLIMIRVLDINKRKPRSEITFIDGECKVDETLYEDHLFITILDSITVAMTKLLHEYCYKIKC